MAVSTENTVPPRFTKLGNSNSSVQIPIPLHKFKSKLNFAEARKMGFKGEPTAIVYHPAHGAEKTYVLEHYSGTALPNMETASAGTARALS